MNRIIHLLFLAVVSFWCLLPFLWQWITSFKAPGTASRLPPLLPNPFSLDHYVAVLGQKEFLQVIVNSVGIALGSTALSLVIGSLGAFGISRLMGRRKELVLIVLLAVFMLPQVAVVTPFYKLLSALNLRDTWTALIGVYAVFTVPLVVWVMVQVFDAIPESLYRAARVDGCTPWRIFLKIYLPLGKSGWISAGLLSLVFCWNEFLFALTFTTTFEARTIPVGISLFSGQYSFPWGEITAACSLVTIPILVIVAYAQKYLVRGLTGAGTGDKP